MNCKSIHTTKKNKKTTQTQSNTNSRLLFLTPFKASNESNIKKGASAPLPLMSLHFAWLREFLNEPEGGNFRVILPRKKPPYSHILFYY